MEDDIISLKEDASFEILPCLENDENVTEKNITKKRYKEDTVGNEENLIIEQKDDFSNSFFNLGTHRTYFDSEPFEIVSSNTNELSCNFASLNISFINSTDNPAVTSKYSEEMIQKELDVEVITPETHYSSDSFFQRSFEAVKTPVTTEIIPFNNQPMYNPTILELDAKLCPYGAPQDPADEYSSYQRALHCETSKPTKYEYYPHFSNSEKINSQKFERIVCEEMPENNKGLKLLERRNCDQLICQAVNNSIEFCSWLQSRKCVQRFVKRAKSSIKNLVNTVELELNQIIGTENQLKLTVITDGSSLQPIEDAFTEVFSGQILISSINVNDVTIPVLPIGNSAGLQAAEKKISYAKQQNLIHEDTVLVSTSMLLHQAVPERWQMTTIIYLDDPMLNLSLHNFAATTPIANAYVAEAERLTPSNHPLRQYGLAVSIEQAIESMNGMKSKDIQEFLTGYNQNNSLKSAALILAGMYKKYVNGCA